VATFEALGGTGALRVGADFLRRLYPQAGVWISNPSWENHRALFEAAGFAVQAYPYYDPATHGLRFDAMLEALRGLPAHSIVVLHACCHNPTGVDLNAAQWDAVVSVVRERGLVAFLDMAYQGFAEGIEADAMAVRKFADSGLSFFVSSSFSKSFSLYGERVGALSIVTADRDEAARVTSQVKRVIRTNYSNPPTHGARRSSLRCCPRRSCANGGSASSPECAIGSARCAPDSCSGCARMASTGISPSSSASAGCSRIPG